MNNAEKEQAIKEQAIIEAMRPYRSYPEFGEGDMICHVDWENNRVLSIHNDEHLIVFDEPIDFSPYFKDKP